MLYFLIYSTLLTWEALYNRFFSDIFGSTEKPLSIIHLTVFNVIGWFESLHGEGAGMDLQNQKTHFLTLRFLDNDLEEDFLEYFFVKRSSCNISKSVSGGKPKRMTS